MKVINITNGEYFNDYISKKKKELFIPFNESLIQGNPKYPLLTPLKSKNAKKLATNPTLPGILDKILLQKDVKSDIVPNSVKMPKNIGDHDIIVTVTNVTTIPPHTSTKPRRI